MMPLPPDLLAPGRLWYLATAYSKHPHGLEDAFVMASHAAASLLKRGVTVFAPIAHSHPIAVHGELDPFDHGIWMPFDLAIAARMDGLLVLKSDGWESSKGIQMEREFFEFVGKPIYFLDPADI